MIHAALEHPVADPAQLELQPHLELLAVHGGKPLDHVLEGLGLVVRHVVDAFEGGSHESPDRLLLSLEEAVVDDEGVSDRVDLDGDHVHSTPSAIRSAAWLWPVMAVTVIWQLVRARRRGRAWPAASATAAIPRLPA